MPVGAAASVVVLKFRLYPIPHRNFLGFGHRSEIGAFRGQAERRHDRENPACDRRQKRDRDDAQGSHFKSMR